MKQAITETMGIDLGDRWSHVYVLSTATGEVLAERRVRTRVDELTALFAGRAPMRVVLETGTHSNWVARLASRHGHEAIVGQARRLRMIYENPNKSDAVDARMLADLGSTHPQLLHPVKVRSEQIQTDLAVLRARENLVEARTKLVNAARGLAKSLGHVLPESSTESFPRKAWEDCPEGLRPALRPLLLSIASLTREIRAAEREVLRLCRGRYAEQVTPLLQVPGVAELTALAFVLVVGDPARFPRTRDLGAFLGLVPRRDQSGASDPQLPITKCGDPMLRRLLGQSAHWILGPFGRDCDLRRWGQGQVERRGKGGKGRVLVAVTRRLGVLLLALWKSGAPYEPLRNANARASDTTAA
jgi:transposase